MPWQALTEVVGVLTFGAKKYVPWGWVNVDNAVERYDAALMRHWVAYKRGETKDPESGKHPLAHLVCDGLFLLAFAIGKTR
jgi:hypothetical protein